MTKNDIIRMARQAGLQPYYDEQEPAIEAFANLVALAERDVLLRQIRHWALTNLNTDLVAYIDAIRARKTT
jgi:hypothetical protein